MLSVSANLLLTTWELKLGKSGFVVADDGSITSRGTGERSSVTKLLLDVGDNSTLRHGGKGKSVTNGKSS